MSDQIPQDGTMSHLHRNANPDAEPEVSIEEQLSNSRAEAHELFKELQAERARANEFERKHTELEASLDPRHFSIEEKARRLQEDPESLGIPKKNPALQRDTSQDNVPSKPRRISEEEFKAMTTEERMALDPRSITGRRLY